MAQLRPKNQFIFSLILLSLAVGIFWVLQAWSNPLESDEVGYWRIAKNLCQFNRYSLDLDSATLTMSRTPLYPLLISGFYCLGLDNPNIIRVFQVFLFIGIIVLVYLNAKLIFNEPIARLAGLLTAFFPAIGFLIGQLHTEITFIFLSLVSALFLIKLFKELKISYAIWSGIFFGLTTLTRPVFFLFPLFLIVTIFILNKFRITHLLKNCFILLIFFALVVSPWLVRNYLVFADSQISDISGVTFYGPAYRINYYSNQEIKYYILVTFLDSYLTKRIDPSYDYSFTKFEPHAFRRSDNWPTKFGPAWEKKLTQHQEYKILYNEAKKLLLKHPIKYISFGFLEFVRLHQPILIEFGTTDLFAGTHNNLSDTVKTTIILSIKLFYLLFFIVVYYGLIKSIIKKNKLSCVIIIIIAYMSALLCLFNTLTRYNIPFYPFHFMFFSYGIIILYSKIFSKPNIINLS